MKKSFNSIIRYSGIAVASLTLILGTGYVFAAPSSPPSAGTGVDLPLTVGSTAQVKEGNLTINGQLEVNGTMCINGDCQTEWPSGGIVPFTVSGAAFIPGYCFNFSSYDKLKYYHFGNFTDQNIYNCGAANANFSVTMPSGLPAGSTILSSSNETVWCHGGSTNYTYTGDPTTYVTDSYYYIRTAASDVTISSSGDNMVVSGTCRFSSLNASYTYRAIRVESADVMYL